MAQNNTHQNESIKDYYGDVFENNDKILNVNEKTLSRVTEKKVQKRLKDHKTFLGILEIFRISNRNTKDYSDFIIGVTENLLLDGDVEFTDEELKLFLCLLDVYSTTSSGSNTMESHVSTLKYSSKIFGSRQKGDERLNIANKILDAMLSVIHDIKNTLQPIKKFAKKVIDNFNERIKMINDSLIANFYGNMYRLERNIMSTKAFNEQLRIIEPENFDKKFNDAFNEYLKINLASC